MINAPYQSRALLDKATVGALSLGVRIMQGCRMAPTDEGHVSALLQFMQPEQGATILDVGCGFGEVSRLMKIERPDLDFILVNKNEMQLKYAPRELQRIQADMHDLPLADNSVDGVMFCYSLCHADHAAALKEASRVTRRGGLLFIYDYDRISGDDILFESRLAARAITPLAMIGVATGNGWMPSAHCQPHTDDALFRYLYANDAEYRAIFQHIVPALWRMHRQ